MKNNPRISAGFFVTRSGLVFFSQASENLIELPLSSQIVSDLEIVSQSSLQRVLLNWLEQIKIVPGYITLILDDSVYFSTKLKQIPTDDSDQEIQAFLESVPFDDSILKTFSRDDGEALVVAVNQDFLQPLIACLEKVGFIVLCVFPALILGINSHDTPFNKEIATSTIRKMDELQKYNILSSADVSSKIVSEHPFLEVKIDKKIILMIVVFAFLLAVLVVLLIFQKNSKT